MSENKISSWKMTEPKGEFQLSESSFPELIDNEVLVKVAGCGVCHTDLSFWHYGVKTKHELPLTPGTRNKRNSYSWTGQLVKQKCNHSGGSALR